MGTSNVSTVARTEKSDYNELPKELHEMRIKDEKSNNHSEKVYFVIDFFNIMLHLISVLFI